MKDDDPTKVEVTIQLPRFRWSRKWTRWAWALAAVVMVSMIIDVASLNSLGGNCTSTYTTVGTTTTVHTVCH